MTLVDLIDQQAHIMHDNMPLIGKDFCVFDNQTRGGLIIVHFLKNYIHLLNSYSLRESEILIGLLGVLALVMHCYQVFMLFDAER